MKKSKSTEREGRHAVSCVSRGSREKNFRGAKLTGKGEKSLNIVKLISFVASK